MNVHMGVPMHMEAEADQISFSITSPSCYFLKLYIYIFGLHMFMYHVCSVHRSQKRVSDPVELCRWWLAATVGAMG